MAITRTTVIIDDGNDKLEFTVEGQANKITATGLAEGTTYTATATVEDDGWGEIESDNSVTFTTMSAGEVTIKSVSTVWNDSTCTVSAVYSSKWPIDEKSAIGYWSISEDMSDPETLKPSVTASSTTEGVLIFTAKAEPGEYYMAVTLADMYGYVNDKEVYTIK